MARASAAVARLLISSLLASALLFAQYTLGPDSQRQAGVPQGTVTKYTWNSSQIFPGTTRNYWIYVPAQYDPAKPACLMVFQDGGGYVNETGAWRVPIVFDNLIQRKEMPVTIGVFIDPGILPARLPNQQQNRYNRSYEYDALGDRYVRFLLTEILPQVEKQYNISRDPNDRAIGGSSSGGIAAFTAAWNRPDSFHRVLSFIGSYTDLRGGDAYPALIRKMEPKPLRVFLQDGTNDLNIYAGNWYLNAQRMESALQYAGYETKLVVGTEGHNSKQGGSILPDALRWLWQGYPNPISKPASTAGERHFISMILDPGSDWQLVSEPPPSAVSLSSNPEIAKSSRGEIYTADRQRDQIRLTGNGHKSRIVYQGDPKGEGIVSPGGVRLSPDESLLLVSDSVTRFVWSFEIQPDGSLMNGEPFFRLELSNDEEPGLTQSGGSGMTFDTEGYLYVATNLGIQICDATAKVVGIIRNPESQNVSSLVFAGPDFDTLYATVGSKTYRRKLRRRGFPSSQPFKPPQPHL